MSIMNSNNSLIHPVYSIKCTWNKLDELELKYPQIILLILFSTPFLSDLDLFLYVWDLWNECLKPVFVYKITFRICVFVLGIHKGNFLVYKLVWNVLIKFFGTQEYYLKFTVPNIEPRFTKQNYYSRLNLLLIVNCNIE